MFCRPHLPHLPGTSLIRVLQLLENRAQKKFILENFLTNFGLKKIFQKIFKFFCLKRFTKDGSLTSPSDRPMHAAIWHIRALLIF